MHVQESYEYAVIRIVPRVEREEFMNVGVILFSRVRKYLGALCAFDESRALKLFPSLDVSQVERHLAQLVAISTGAEDAGPIAALPIHERFHWLVAPRSTIVQTSATHSGISRDPETTLRELVARLVE